MDKEIDTMTPNPSADGGLRKHHLFATKWRNVNSRQCSLRNWWMKTKTQPQPRSGLNITIK